MTRRTSIEAYRKCKELGLLSKRRLEIFAVIAHHGPLTAGEIGRCMPEYRSAVSTADRNIHARLTELRDRGVIFERGERECSVTKMRVIEWDATGDLPAAPPKKMSQFTKGYLQGVQAASDLACHNCAFVILELAERNET